MTPEQYNAAHIALLGGAIVTVILSAGAPKLKGIGRRIIAFFKGDDTPTSPGITSSTDPRVKHILEALNLRDDAAAMVTIDNNDAEKEKADIQRYADIVGLHYFRQSKKKPEPTK